VNYLVDTHIFLWSILSSQMISPKIRDVLSDPKHSIFISDISFWEISIKYQLKKLDLGNTSPEQLPVIAKKAGFTLMNLNTATASTFYKLPRFKHKDPFDRMLIWQAISEGLYFISMDSDLRRYRKYGLRWVE
jgi:PIN domain nuclease of toxin-antitoxin system